MLLFFFFLKYTLSLIFFKGFAPFFSLIQHRGFALSLSARFRLGSEKSQRVLLALLSPHAIDPFYCILGL